MELEDIVHGVYLDAENSDAHLIILEKGAFDVKRQILEGTAVFSKEGQIELIRKAALTIKHAHDRGYVHCDIKPEQFIVFHGKMGGLQALKLCDWDSAAKIGESVTGPTTALFCPPERATGQSVPASPELDSWAFGMMVFFICSRRQYFQGLSDDEALAALASPNFRVKSKQLSHLDKDAKALVLGLLEERWSMKRALEHRFLMGGQTVTMAAEQHQKAMGAVDNRLKNIDARTRGISVSQKEMKSTLSDISDTVHSIDDRTVRIEGLSMSALHGQDVLKTLIQTKADNVCPSVFTVVPASLARSVAGLADDDRATEEREVEEEEEEAEAEESGIFGAFKASFADALGRAYYVQLLEQYTMEPVPCGADGLGYLIRRPRDFFKKCGPLLETSIKVARVVNGVGKLGKLFGMPVPEVHDHQLAKVQRFAGRMDQDPVVDFGCLASAFDADDLKPEDGDLKQQLMGASLRQFARFLGELDPKAGWGGLELVVLAGGEGMWVSEESRKLLQAGILPTAPPLAAAAVQAAPAASATPLPYYKALTDIKIRAGVEMDSAEAGALPKGAGIQSLGEVENSQGLMRVHFTSARYTGWVSLISSQGTPLLMEVDGAEKEKLQQAQAKQAREDTLIEAASKYSLAPMATWRVPQHQHELEERDGAPEDYSCDICEADGTAYSCAAARCEADGVAVRLCAGGYDICSACWAAHAAPVAEPEHAAPSEPSGSIQEEEPCRRQGPV